MLWRLSCLVCKLWELSRRTLSTLFTSVGQLSEHTEVAPSECSQRRLQDVALAWRVDVNAYLLDSQPPADLRRPHKRPRVLTANIESNVPHAKSHSSGHWMLLSAQCISSIGQIIKSVCVSVSEWVSEWVRHTKRVERSTDRNLPPIFTKRGTKVETQEVWLPIVFGGNPKYLYPPNRKWN